MDREAECSIVIVVARLSTCDVLPAVTVCGYFSLGCVSSSLVTTECLLASSRVGSPLSCVHFVFLKISKLLC